MVDKLTFKEALRVIENLLEGKKASQVSTLNAEFVLAAQDDKDFRKAIKEATLVLADGIGILWAAKFLSLKHKNTFTYFLSLSGILLRPKWVRGVLPDKVSGSDLFWPLLELASRKGKKVFLLGAASGVAEQVEKIAVKNFPDLQIVGTYAGSPRAQEEASIVDKINSSGADLILVAYNFLEQEKWIHRNLKKLKTIKVAIGLGGTFDFVVGAKALGKGFRARRAPLTLRKLGLEWLWRLLTQPYRWRRIWNAVFRFSWRVYKKK